MVIPILTILVFAGAIIIFFLLRNKKRKRRKNDDQQDKTPKKIEYRLYVSYFADTPLEMLKREREIISVYHESELPSLPRNCYWLSVDNRRGISMDIEFPNCREMFKEGDYLDNVMLWSNFIEGKKQEYKQFLIKFRKIIESDIPFREKVHKTQKLEEEYKNILGDFEKIDFNDFIEKGFGFDIAYDLKCTIYQAFNLVRNEYFSVEKIANAKVKELEEKTGFTHRVAVDLIERAKNKMGLSRVH